MALASTLARRSYPRIECLLPLFKSPHVCFGSFSGHVDIPMLPLLFQQFRTPALTNRVNPLTHVFKAADTISRDLSNIHLNSTTCFQLPLPLIWIPASPTETVNDVFPRNPGLNKLFAYHLVTVDASTQYISSVYPETNMRFENVVPT
jgi:hypothetical protein